MYFSKKIPFILLLILALPGASIADHSWGNYKWKTDSLPFSLDLGDNVNQDWQGYLFLASDDWSVSTMLDTNVIAGSTATDPLSCNFEINNVQVCNAGYGNTGWLGLAQIRLRGNTIIAGAAKLNDTYFNLPRYDTIAARRMVMCQEVAHTFGLGHQDETFDNVNLGSCMDYTDDPDGSIGGEASNEFPNQHDYDQLIVIYAGSDSGGNDSSCNPRSPNCNSTSRPGNSNHGKAEWGRLVSGHGGVEVYERALGNGNRLITHVTWTIEHAENH